MTVNEYQSAALRTVNLDLTNFELLQDGLMGLNGEAGEALDILKKHMFQCHDLDERHIVKELGDIAWYLAITAHALGYPLEEVLQMNIDKLKKRYPDGFDEEKSLNRAEGDM